MTFAKRLRDQISALREAALDLPNGAELTQVLKLLQDAEGQESQRLRERLHNSLPERRNVENPPGTINAKIATMMGTLRNEGALGKAPAAVASFEGNV